MSAAGAEALALLQAGRLAEAEAAWRGLLAREPGDAHAMHFLGCTLAQSGRRDEALALLDRSLEAEPRNAMYLNNRARVLSDLGRTAEAESDLRRAALHDPPFLPALLNLAGLLQRRGRPGEAIAPLRRALAREPAHAEALFLLAYCLHATGQPAEAARRYEEAVRARPAFPEALVNWGNALKDLGDLDGAAARYDAALALRPDLPDALVNAGSVALDRGRPAQARARYARALVLAPGDPNARYGLGQVALREGRFAEGWAGYAARFDTRPPQAARRAPALPELQAAHPGAARRVAVWSEQGIGDQVLFSTLLPELRGRLPALVAEVDPRLAAAYRRSVEGIDFVASPDAAAAFASCDAQVALGALPALLRPDAASFARQPAALLVPDPARVAAMRARLGPGRWIAVSWRSVQRGARGGLARRKSVPLAQFAPLARVEGARLLDLQYGDVDEERRAFAAAHPGRLVRLEDLDTFNDLEGMLAALAACERVVTVSNVTAHLAGALGVPTHLVFLAGWAPFHYWAGAGGGPSLWYPSVELPDPAWASGEEAAAALAARIAAGG